MYFSFTGHYLYVDSTNTTNGQKAKLRSQMFSQAARGCYFSFWYYIFGGDFGTLKVLQYTPSNGREYNLMTAPDRDYDQSLADKWNLYEIQVEACAENFRVSV